jgi:hypothetical protein
MKTKEAQHRSGQSYQVSSSKSQKMEPYSSVLQENKSQSEDARDAGDTRNDQTPQINSFINYMSANFCSARANVCRP